MRVLITEADHKNTLAAVRALGMNGIEIVVSGRKRLEPAFYSKYCKKKYIYSDPVDHEVEFVKDIIDIVTREKIDVILPIGAESCVVVSKYKGVLSKITKVAVSDYAIFLKAYDKLQTIEIGKEIGVPCPKTFGILEFEDLENIIKELGFPIVLKAKKGSGYSGVKIINKRSELRKKYDDLINVDTKNENIYDHRNIIVQEYIPGDIHDVCIFANHGHIIRAVTQKRIKTLPVIGGGGIWNITTNNVRLIEYSKKLIHTIQYHGPAQIEFKLDKEGMPRLIEINPKFWGTLDLSIQAGVNFPLISARVAMGEKLNPNYCYKEGFEYIWIFPYQFVSFLRTKEKVKCLLDLRRLLRRNVATEFSLTDILPNIVTIFASFFALFKKEAILKTFR